MNESHTNHQTDDQINKTRVTHAYSLSKLRLYLCFNFSFYQDFIASQHQHSVLRLNVRCLCLWYDFFSVFCNWKQSDYGDCIPKWFQNNFQRVVCNRFNHSTVDYNSSRSHIVATLHCLCMCVLISFAARSRARETVQSNGLCVSYDWRNCWFS